MLSAYHGSTLEAALSENSFTQLPGIVVHAHRSEDANELRRRLQEECFDNGREQYIADDISGLV